MGCGRRGGRPPRARCERGATLDVRIDARAPGDGEGGAPLGKPIASGDRGRLDERHAPADKRRRTSSQSSCRVLRHASRRRSSFNHEGASECLLEGYDGDRASLKSNSQRPIIRSLTYFDSHRTSPFPQGRNTTRARAQSSTARGQDRVRDVARHVSVLQGDAARAGGDLELLHRRPRCGSPPPQPPKPETFAREGFSRSSSALDGASRDARPAVVLRPEPLSALRAEYRECDVAPKGTAGPPSLPNLGDRQPGPTLQPTYAGLVLPVVVPPIRDSFTSTTPVPPPNPHAVAKSLRGQ